MSKKLSGKLPEIANGLVKNYTERVGNYEGEVRKRAGDTVAAYAAVLGWYALEDGGVIDIKRCKKGLIELRGEVDKLMNNSGYLMVREARTNTEKNILIGGVVKTMKPTVEMYYDREAATVSHRYRGGGMSEPVSTEDYDRAVKIVEAYNLLLVHFEDFNDFVKELWVEYSKEIGEEGDARLNEWEREKGEYNSQRNEEVNRIYLDQAAKELDVLKSTEEGQRKRKLPPERRLEIMSEIGKNIEEFDKPMPPRKVVDVNEKTSKSRLSMEEFREAYDGMSFKLNR